jgi:ribose transport system ATP-binding protein
MAMPAVSNLLALAGISKSFPGVKALDSVALNIAGSEVVALIGENGAGKSTLIRILAGIHQPDSGSIRIGDDVVELRSPRDAGRHGIAIIHQELELVDSLDVAANVFLGREPTWGGPARFIDSKQIRTKTEEILSRLRAPISARAQVGSLSLAHKQMVEIARALSLNAKILLMDEPTSSLTAAETDRLLDVVRELRAQGVAIIYISHRLTEVQQIANRVVVVRDGRNAGELHGAEITHDRMIQMMVGRDLKTFYSSPSQMPSHSSREAQARQRAAIKYELQKLRTRRYPQSEISMTIRAGEILGIAGLVGAGRSELAHAVFGIEPPLSGELLSGGHPMKIQSPKDAVSCGIYLVPEDRRSVGLVTEMTVRENITLPALARYSFARIIQRKLENNAAMKMCDALKIRTPSMEATAATLSGGNQQKVVLAKWLSLNPKLILFDEPTRGIDVGAKAEIYQLMRKLADEGVAIVMISSDMEEILGNSDRVAVMHDGRITGILGRAECSQEAIMRLAVA